MYSTIVVSSVIAFKQVDVSALLHFYCAMYLTAFEPYFLYSDHTPLDSELQMRTILNLWSVPERRQAAT